MKKDAKQDGGGEGKEKRRLENRGNAGALQTLARGTVPIVFAPEDEFFPALKLRAEKRRAARELGLDLIRVYTEGNK